MRRALEKIGALWQRARRVQVTGNREYNPSWHTALDLDHLLTAAEAVTRSGLERKESRGGHFREDYPEKSAELGKVNIVVRKAAEGRMEVSRVPIPEMPSHLKQVIEEMK
jgi:succinate dehydrogenase / fumarate reductase, flavoprotein subunit